MLLAILHLMGEIEARDSLDDLPSSDMKHIAYDIKRVYDHLIWQWLDYMRHLHEPYPYLYSLEIRTSPFNKNAQAVITE